MRLIVLSCLFSVCAFAQSTRTVTLTWTDTVNPSGTTYSVYKSSTVPPAAPVFTKIAQGVAAKTYVDAGVTPGVYKYYVTAVLNTSESVPSNIADADAKPFIPLLLRAEVDVVVN